MIAAARLPVSVCTSAVSNRILLPQNPKAPLQLSLPLGMTSDESQGWYFFRSKTVDEIRGCFQSNLWERLILQISHEEPSILHASIALGSMHRKYKERGVSISATSLSDPAHVFSLRQYVKAIGSLRTRLRTTGDSRTREVTLITCLLFICLEMLQGQRIGALTHLQTGLRILSRSVSQNDGLSSEPTQLVLKHDPDTVVDQLTDVFARLDYESTMFGQQSPHLRFVPEQSVAMPYAWVPATFFNIQEARQYLDTLSSAVFRFRGCLLETAKSFITEPIVDVATAILSQHAIARSLDLSSFPALLGQLRVLQNSLAIWLSALKAYNRPKSLFCLEDSRAISLLEIQHFYVYFLISNCQSTKEMSCDSFNDDFKKILALSMSYLKDKPLESSTSEPLHRTFTLESGVLPSLYLISMKCRDPILRRQAISMVYRATCQEGMWEGSIIARYVEQIADFEEAAANYCGELSKSDDIPEFARFSDVILALSEDPSYGRLICARYRHEIDGKLHVWEEIFPLKG